MQHGHAGERDVGNELAGAGGFGLAAVMPWSMGRAVLQPNEIIDFGVFFSEWLVASVAGGVGGLKGGVWWGVCCLWCSTVVVHNIGHTVQVIRAWLPNVGYNFSEIPMIAHVCAFELKVQSVSRSAHILP